MTENSLSFGSGQTIALDQRHRRTASTPRRAPCHARDRVLRVSRQAMKESRPILRRSLEPSPKLNGRMTRADGLAGDRACGSMMFLARERVWILGQAGDGKDVLGAQGVD